MLYPIISKLGTLKVLQKYSKLEKTIKNNVTMLYICIYPANNYF